MKTTYRHSWLGFLVAILMVPTAYGQGETVLVANFMNGNNSVLNSRVYLFNPTDTAGEITVRVFRLPLMSGVPQELTGAPLSLGILGPKSAVNIKLAEDILAPLGIAMPYIDDGGNLTLELTIGSDKVRGVAQVFTSDFAFGTYPLQGPESISGTGPSGEIQDGAVTTIKIADGAVTGSKIANGAVGSVQLAEQVDFGGTGIQGFTKMLNSTGTVVSVIGTNINDQGILTLDGSTGSQAAILGATTTNNGGLFLYTSGSNLLAQMGVNTGGTGALNLNNPAGNTVIALTTGAGDESGFISVSNASGTLTAGIDGFTGEVFGNSKSFIVTDPSDSNRMIKYTSVEGPEAAIYVRGTANLVSGQGQIEFPDHFAVMAVPSSITVSLTPRSARSMGLAAVGVSSQGIEVAELGGGRNSHTFDYVAYAVRKGFEDYEVYLTKEQPSELTGPASRMVQPLSPVQTGKALESGSIGTLQP